MANTPVPLIPNPFNVNTLNIGGMPAPSVFGAVVTSTGTGGAVGNINPNNSLLSSSSIQMFRTIPVPNRLANLFSLHCYKKSLSPHVSSAPPNPASLFISNALGVLKGVIYNFPVSPAGYTRMINAVTARYMTKGQNSHSQSNQGQVSYSFDRYGYSPPSFLIEGTTGWKYHTLDGGSYSGYQSFHRLQYILQYYYDKNSNLSNENDAYVLALYDYFNQIYWEVEPIGDQTFSMSESAPLNGYYRLYFEGNKNVANPPNALELRSVLDQVITNVIVGAANTALSAAAPFVGAASDVLAANAPLGT